MTNRQWKSRLHMRLFCLWQTQRTIPCGPLAGRGLTHLEADRLRKQVDREGYGDGCSLGAALGAALGLGDAPAGCTCPGCIEGGAGRAATDRARASFLDMIRCPRCGRVGWCLCGEGGVIRGAD